MPWLSACHTAWSPLPIGLGGTKGDRGPGGLVYLPRILLSSLIYEKKKDIFKPFFHGAKGANLSF